MSDDCHALALNWLYGTATNVTGNTVNLSNGYSDRVAFIAAHTAVIYDKRLQKQIFMQGHCNSISCILVTDDRAIIITSDVGDGSLLVLWNSKTGNPIQSIVQPHKFGTVAMDLSPDDEWLVTVGAADPESGEQEIALWSVASLRSDADSRPCVMTTIPVGDVQLSVRFNMNDSREIITNGKRRVYFWSHQYPSAHRFKYYSPPLKSKDFKQPVGDFIASVFVPGSAQALTATSDGDLVVWDEQGITAQMGTRASDRRACKLMRIHHSAITVLTTIGDYIVSGGKDGYVRFYDPLLRIVAWFEDLDVGPIASIAFSAAPPSKLATAEPADTINRFIAPDFVVSTTESKLISVQTASFEEYDMSRRRGIPIVEPIATGIADVAAHPTRAEFAVLASSGVLQRWDLVTHACLASRTFPKLSGAKIAYSRDGAFIVAGFGEGSTSILDTDTLGDIHSARNTSAAVTMMACSTSGDQVAVADAAHHVILYACLPHKETRRWEFIGRTQTHHDKVSGLSFGESPSGETRLFSIGADGRLVDYDLQGSSTTAGLRLKHHIDLPSTVLPTALAFAPPLQYFRHHSSETLLLAADAGFKIRMFNADARRQVATFLGPTFGGPVSRLIMFKSATSQEAFLAYSTPERVVGLLAWPMDGDPAKTMGLIAHPGAITAMAVSYDGRKLLTASGVDGTLAVWDIRVSVLGSSPDSPPPPSVSRWESMLADPELVEDLQEYFLYAQVKAQGEGCMAPRSVPGTIPASLVPDVLRAAGFYPSQADVDVMMAHLAFIAAFRDLGDDGSVLQVGFDDLLCIHANHRPLVEATQEDIAKAFLTLGANPNNGKLTRDQLLGLLQQIGEPMGVEELTAALATLTGVDKLAKTMPNLVDAAAFSNDVLGFEREEIASSPAV